MMKKRENKIKIEIFRDFLNYNQKILKNMLTFQRESGKISGTIFDEQEDIANSDTLSLCATIYFNIGDTAQISEIAQIEQVYDFISESNAISKRNDMIDTIVAAKYLVNLFKNTTNEEGEHYACSTLKLGKLLTLAAFLYACVSDDTELKLLNDRIISLKCGATINNIDFIILDYQGTVESCRVIGRERIGNIHSNLEKEHEKLLKYVFCNFGAFPQRRLGMYIDCYKPDGIREYETIRIDAYLKNKLLAQSVDKLEYKLDSFIDYVERYRTWADDNGTAEATN